MSTTSDYHVTHFGALGVAETAETLRLEHLHWKWIRYAPETAATVYRRRNGQPLDSVGIQAAIDAAHAAGGGRVVVPAGNYLIGPIELKSQVELHLSAGARLWGSLDLADYEGRPEDLTRLGVEHSFQRHQMRSFRRLVSAVDAEHIAITGRGQISGQSPGFVIPWMNTRPSGVILDRPSDSILFHRCRDVVVEGIRLLDTPNWSLVFDTCSHVRVHGLTLHAFDVINSDGIDLVDTTDATISDCNIWCCDDGICLKSTRADAKTARIAVSNCTIRTLCNSLKFGTDSAGVFEDITFSNIVVHNPDGDAPGSERGSINLNAIDGGTIRNVNISNVVMRNVHCPFFLIAGCRMEQQKRYRTPRPGLIDGVSITNLRAEGTRYPAFVFADAARPARDIHVANVTVRKTAGHYTFAPPAVPDETGERYPTPYLFGSHDRDNLPAYGLFVRNAERVTVRDFRVDADEAEVRPMVCIEQAADVTIRGLCGDIDRDDLVQLQDVEDADVGPVRVRRRSRDHAIGPGGPAGAGVVSAAGR